MGKFPNKVKSADWEKIVGRRTSKRARAFSAYDGFDKKELVRNRRKKTRAFIDNEFIERGYMRHFPLAVTAVYVALCKYADFTYQFCFPSIVRIQDDTGIGNKKTVIDALRQLNDFRLIQIIKTKGGAHRSNVYFLMDPICWLPIRAGPRKRKPLPPESRESQTVPKSEERVPKTQKTVLTGIPEVF